MPTPSSASFGVSVIIPAFNTGDYIGEAIRSVLAQSLPPLEILVIDDGSDDGTAEVAEAFGDPVRVFRRTNVGIGASRNFGVSQARGNLLAFLDADDLWTEEKTREQVNVLVASAASDGVFGLVRQFYTEGLEVSAEKREQLSSSVDTGLHAGTLLIRKESFDRVGPFDEHVRMGEFIDWYARSKDAGLNFERWNQVAMFRRIHRRNTGITRHAERNDYAKVLKAVLNRRKPDAGRQDPRAPREP